MFKKKAKTNPTPVEAAEIFRRAIVDATDAAERAHVGLPAMITVLANATENLKYRVAVNAPSSFEYDMPRELRRQHTQPVATVPAPGVGEKLLDILRRN